MSKTIGYLWKKSSGDLIANGILEAVAGFQIKISIFRNTKKQKPTDPDYNMIVSREIIETKEEQKKDNGGFD